MTSDTSHDEVLSSENEEILASDTPADEMTTADEIMTNEIIEHTGDEMTAPMAENQSQNEHTEGLLVLDLHGLISHILQV